VVELVLVADAVPTVVVPVSIVVLPILRVAVLVPVAVATIDVDN
jgi:hypothetical protein